MNAKWLFQHGAVQQIRFSFRHGASVLLVKMFQRRFTVFVFCSTFFPVLLFSLLLDSSCVSRETLRDGWSGAGQRAVILAVEVLLYDLPSAINVLCIVKCRFYLSFYLYTGERN